MRSVDRRFQEFSRMYPHHSSLIVFGRAVKGQGFSRRMVALYFNKCVDKGDYPKGEKKDFLRFYYKMTALKIKPTRSSKENTIWRKSVLERDEYTCTWCGSKENLEVDHILPYAYYEEGRFDIENGRTLCHDCHLTTDTYAGNLKKRRQIV